jgi:2-polyprenyl-3-methyl-5-hydroxy-6-metoxy-1,4-benzoquinol methylase
MSDSSARLAKTRPVTNEDYASQYDGSYYESHCGPVPYKRSEPQWAVVFGGVADQLIRAIGPRRIFDVGCALGFLVEAFWDRGVEASGIDISRYAIENVRADLRNHCRIGSAAEPIEGGPYDLVTCVEVLEHIPEQEALLAIRNMTEITETILFSSTPYAFEEPTHVNVRPTLYWLDAFRARGFAPDFLFDASFVAPHAMLLRRTQTPADTSVLRLFAQVLHLRHLLTERTNQFNERTRDLGVAQAQMDQASAGFQRDTHELRRQADQLLGETESLRRQLRDAEISVAHNQAELERTATELHRSETELERKRTELERVSAELHQARIALSQQEAMQQLVRKDLDAAAGQIAAYLQNDLNPNSTNAAIAAITDRLAGLEQHVDTIGEAVAGIANSRIWRTLMWGARVLQRLTPAHRP